MKNLIGRWLAPPQQAEPEVLAQAVSGKVVLVTGASFGIGEALARRLGAAGARVLLAARSLEELQSLAALIRQRGGEAHCFQLDLREAEQIDRVASSILEQFGGVDILVHNAGKSIRRSLLKALDRPHDFERCAHVNYLGPVRLQLALLPKMIERRGGQIVNVSSVGVRMPAVAHWAAYLASKSAFDHWLGAAVPELRPYGIACTSVYLGLVHTRMSAPTKEYASMPGLSADQAACVLCRALIRRPRSLQPWWLGPVHLLSPMLERPLEWLQWLWFSR
ncbi:SDR family NAD(P)-dependent oxidoreductase [bacterium]|nr:SDR family NAD(P)-dependent oxidoreductase [bacterium]